MKTWNKKMKEQTKENTVSNGMEGKKRINEGMKVKRNG